jgi:hypothetical protein
MLDALCHSHVALNTVTKKVKSFPLAAKDCRVTTPVSVENQMLLSE